MKFSIKNIYNFAQTHSIGSDVFINNRTGEIIELPNPDHNPYTELEEFFSEDLKKIENNWQDITKLECPESFESYQIMESFVDSLDESEIKDRLASAINQNKPFSKFNHIIHNSDKREDWFEHKRLELEDRIIKLLRIIEKTNG